MKHIVVVGAGLNGLCSAYFLRKKGWEVTLLERNKPGLGCSYGNAGLIVPSHFVPLASPGVISRSLRWMFSPESPLSLRLQFTFRELRWLWSFYKNCTRSHVHRSMSSLYQLHMESRSLYMDMAREIDMDLKNQGLIMLYRTKKGEEDEKELAGQADRLGMQPRLLERDQITEMNNHLAFGGRGGVLYPYDSQLKSEKLMSSLRKRLETMGVNIQFQEGVEYLNGDHGKIHSAQTEQGTCLADAYLLTNGVWAEKLVKPFGHDLPLMAGKGYSFQLKNKGIQYPALLNEAAVSVSPYGSVVRFGGAMEIGKPSWKVNENKIRGIRKGIGSFFPDMISDENHLNIWTGLRPLSPDGLPYLGHIEGFTNLFVATGHAMMGVSLAPATGKVMSELIDSGTTGLNIDLYNPNRFNR